MMSCKISSRPLRALAAVTALGLSTMTILAQESTTATTNAPARATGFAAPTAASQTAAQLSFGVPDVLKLSQAKVSDDTIIAYIQTSGRSYSELSASEIVYLHGHGVSDSVLDAMLTQRKQVSAAAKSRPQAPVTQANATTSAPPYPQAYVAPTVTYVQPAPAAMVYGIPNSPTVVDYSYYPSYGYYGYYSPPLSLSFGFGGGYRGGYYYGGGHGGGYRGGGSHGGGRPHR